MFIGNMTICAAFGCNCSNHPKHKKPGEKFYSFPTDPHYFDKWKHLCKVKRLPQKPSLCSCHFAPSAFKPNIHNVIGEPTPRNYRDLRNDAIPTLPLYGMADAKKNAIAPEDTPKSRRAKRRANKKMVGELLASQAKQQKLWYQLKKSHMYNILDKVLHI